MNSGKIKPEIYKLEACEFSQILDVWKIHLWPDRKSEIEPISLIDENGMINADIRDAAVFFWRIVNVENNQTIGCVSSCQTSPTSMRSRGLWIQPDYRNMGLAKTLMSAIFEKALSLKCLKVWTMPRFSSWPFYQKIGFISRQRVDNFEYGPHYLADYNLRSFQK